MRRSDLHDLKHFALFAELGDHDREALASEIAGQELNAGETLFAPGDAADAALFVVEGELLLCAPDGETGCVGEGASVGVLSLVANTRRETGSEAIGHVRLFVLTRSAFERIADASPHTACRLLAALLRDSADLMRSAATDLG